MLIRAAVRTATLFAGQPPTIDGNTLDPEAHAMLRVMARLGLDRDEETPDIAKLRADFERDAPLVAPPPRMMARVISAHAGTMPVRIYVPRGATRALLVFFHGGGGVLGSIRTHDGLCRALADRSKVMVASVEYRLAPEHPFPAPVDDAAAAWAWACEHFGDHRLGVAGDSFGGLLAAAVERRAARKPDLMMLLYPWLDLRLGTPSIDTFAEGFMLTKPMLAWFRAQYASPEAASPGLVDDLTGVPPTVIVTAGFDPLRDEGRAYADRLAAAGASVRYRCEPDQLHGFASMGGGLRRAALATDRLGEDLAAGLGGS